jgi:glyoxylase-like metal-dependent hydrolase (beta-lactamase superfamily II)
MSAPEIARLQSGPFWEDLIGYAQSWGCSDEDLDNLLQAFQGTYRFEPSLGRHLTVVSEGDVLRYGEYAFVCLLTPGHTPGHFCLHEPTHGLLISGDHLLPDVAPFIQVWSERGNPLREHFDSLVRTNGLNPKMVLPGHGPVFAHAQARANQVRHWHERRAAKVFAALKKNPMTPLEAAGHIRSKTPPMIEDEYVKSFHQFIEVAETMAYLRYLQRDSLIEEFPVDGTLTYAVK